MKQLCNLFFILTTFLSACNADNSPSNNPINNEEEIISSENRAEIYYIVEF